MAAPVRSLPVKPLARAALALTLSFSLAACAALHPFGEPLSERIEEHVTVLSSDAFGGRDTGSEGFDKAALYVASFYEEHGIAPAAPAYRQPVPLTQYRAGSVSGSMALTVKRRPVELEVGKDVVFYAPNEGVDGEVVATGSGGLVFVGYGIVAPTLGMDAYEGVDVQGKIVVVLDGAPPIADNPSSVHLRRADVKRREAFERGAVGMITLDPDDRAVERYARFFSAEREMMTIGDGLGEPMPRAAMTLEAARPLFAASGRDLDAILEAASEAQGESFPLEASATITTSAMFEPVDAYNVVGVIPGTDPDLAGQAVVLTAHLDHVGTRDDGDPETDDIYNGALDNAAGTAIIMEAAARLARKGGAARTVIVAALTGEEKGLLGSAHLARTVDDLGYEAVANVNIDMPVLTYPFNDVIGFGEAYSSLQTPLQEAAAEVGVVSTPDPLPELSLFVRSDHYRFVQEGIPSLFLFNGMAGEGKANFEAFMATHYHKPSDEVALPINWKDAARFTDLTHGLVKRIADDPERPRWNAGVVFAPQEAAEPQG